MRLVRLPIIPHETPPYSRPSAESDCRAEPSLPKPELRPGRGKLAGRASWADFIVRACARPGVADLAQSQAEVRPYRANEVIRAPPDPRIFDSKFVVPPQAAGVAKPTKGEGREHRTLLKGLVSF